MFSVLMVYAVVVGWLYYRKDIGYQLFEKRKQLKVAMDAPVKHANENSLPIVHELVSELGSVIKNAAEARMLQPELFYALQKAVRGYLLLRATEFPPKINQYIREELSRYELPPLDEDEYAMLWSE